MDIKKDAIASQHIDSMIRSRLGQDICQKVFNGCKGTGEVLILKNYDLALEHARLSTHYTLNRLIAGRCSWKQTGVTV